MATVKIGRDWRTNEYVSETEAKKNPDRYELIEVKAYKDQRLNILRAMIYEPEHIKGGACWCGVSYKKSKKKMEIHHISQRDTLVEYVQKNFK